ncbi:hypothetical protein LP420_21815 [Massilia sp. B-10]|nr:hypothetical protein LP420_21815 [Massilia sp. B-10]
MRQAQAAGGFVVLPLFGVTGIVRHEQLLHHAVWFCVFDVRIAFLEVARQGGNFGDRHAFAQANHVGTGGGGVHGFHGQAELLARTGQCCHAGAAHGLYFGGAFA